MELIFASHNENKVEEIRKILPDKFQILSLNDIHFKNEIPETGSTLEENAKIKAETIHKLTGKIVFSDDSGLFVEALNGSPGVFSARYAGTGNSSDNIKKLLKELAGNENRNAYFKSIFCVITDDKTVYLDGEVHGKITQEIRGRDGFGYDPVFVPNDFPQTFAEMKPEEKNQISHRFHAVQKLIKFVETLA